MPRWAQIVAGLLEMLDGLTCLVTLALVRPNWSLMFRLYILTYYIENEAL